MDFRLEFVVDCCSCLFGSDCWFDFFYYFLFSFIFLSIIFFSHLLLLKPLLFFAHIFSSPDGSSGESACEGRVVVSYEDEEERTRTLAIVYQSIIIAVTVILGSIFFYYTLKVFQSAKRMASSKRFVIVVGGTFTVAFLTRTILFLIILAADFASAVYLFITLFLTEVLMITFLMVQFNLRQFSRVAKKVSQTNIMSSSGTLSS